MSFIKLREIEIGDLVETFNHEIGVVTDKGKKGLCLSTFSNDIKIFCKDIKNVRFIKPMCLKHHKRYCEICHKKYIKEEISK